MRAARLRLTAADVSQAGDAIVGHWKAQPELARARRVGIYAALPAELPTRPLFEHLRSRGCEVLLPRCAEERLRFAAVVRWADLVPGPYGVLEPPAHFVEVPPAGEDPVLVPGLAFDRGGHRLGQGQGWYDRSFSERDAQRLIGAGFALQVVEAVPCDTWDRRVGSILTERGFTRVTRTS